MTPVSAADVTQALHRSWQVCEAGALASDEGAVRPCCGLSVGGTGFDAVERSNAGVTSQIVVVVGICDVLDSVEESLCYLSALPVVTSQLVRTLTMIRERRHAANDERVDLVMTSSPQHVTLVTKLVGSIHDFGVTPEKYCVLTLVKMSLTLPWQATDLERGVASEVTL